MLRDSGAPHPSRDVTSSARRDCLNGGARDAVLDLGCGPHKVRGAIGLDRSPLPNVDVVHDLEVIPYPFQDNTFRQVYMNHVIEHVTDPLQVLGEVWRISCPGATVHLKLPHFSSFHAWADPTHKRAFCYQTFDYLTAESGWGYYSSSRFTILDRRFIYFLPYPHPGDRWLKPLRPFGLFLERMADAHPFIAERFWCYWVGGFSELRATLRVEK